MERIRAVNGKPERPGGEFVLYWMIAARRTRYSFALQRAVERARALGRPLVVLEALRCGYPWASDRFHRFLLQGMADNGRRLARAGVGYHAYAERAPGDGKGLLAALGRRACLVVTDDYPAFFLPRMVAAAGGALGVRLEAVDGNGLLPMAAADRAFPTAYAFRRFLQAELPAWLLAPPRPDPLARLELPAAPELKTLLRRWPAVPPELLAGERAALAALPIDHGVGPGEAEGGETAARRALKEFVAHRLVRYAEDRNHPDLDGASGLSPWLHFGHLSAHEVFQAVAGAEGWTPARLGAQATGARAGWWGMGESAEAFLDQLVTWRELGFNMCRHRPDHESYDSLPDWARATLERHAGDKRKHIYTIEQFESAETHDPLWNAAQRQLLRAGRLHNYLRMLWGKKILEWSPGPREALATMIELNDKLALDGRDPNSGSGIFWTLGRYDRPWGPERPIFGTVRYMSSENTARKVQVKEYLRVWGQTYE